MAIDNLNVTLFIRDWFANWRADPPDSGWATELMYELVDEQPEDAWALILELIAKAPDTESIGLIAAGPLEELLVAHGPHFIDRVELQSRTDSRFRECAAGVWGWSRMEPEVYSRLQRAVLASSSGGRA